MMKDYDAFLMLASETVEGTFMMVHETAEL